MRIAVLKLIVLERCKVVLDVVDAVALGYLVPVPGELELCSLSCSKYCRDSPQRLFQPLTTAVL